MLGKLFGNGNNVKDSMSKFKRTYNADDFGIKSDVTCQPAQYNKLGEIVVPAQQQITFGSNDPVGGASTAGAPVYLRIDDTGAQLQGKIRFSLSNANETNTVVVLEESTERLSADVNDRQKAVLMPEYPMRAQEDSKLIITFKPAGSSAVTVDYDATNTKLSIPVTVYQ